MHGDAVQQDPSIFPDPMRPDCDVPNDAGRYTERMPTRIIIGHIENGSKNASTWPLEQIRKVTGYADLVEGTLNVRLDAAHTVRKDFILRREERTDRNEDLYFERCALTVSGDRIRALIARTSTNYWTDIVLEIMAGCNLRSKYGLTDGANLEIEVTDGE
jgi:hypothetical protein